jgi:hypothetical protein
MPQAVAKITVGTLLLIPCLTKYSKVPRKKERVGPKI